MDDLDPVRFAILSRRHLARGLRILASGIEQGSVPLTEPAWQLVRQLFDEMLRPTPPADPPTS